MQINFAGIFQANPVMELSHIWFVWGSVKGDNLAIIMNFFLPIKPTRQAPCINDGKHHV